MGEQRELEGRTRGFRIAREMFNEDYPVQFGLGESYSVCLSSRLLEEGMGRSHGKEHSGRY